MLSKLCCGRSQSGHVEPPNDALDQSGLSALQVRLSYTLSVTRPTRTAVSLPALLVSASVGRLNSHA